MKTDFGPPSDASNLTGSALFISLTPRTITPPSTLLRIPPTAVKFTTFFNDRRYDVARRNAMSQYAFHCEDCNKEFTQQHHISDVDKAEIKCPNCGGKNVHQLVSAFSAVTSKKS
jgi:putative FmdB family regulatory protein